MVSRLHSNGISAPVQSNTSRSVAGPPPSRKSAANWALTTLVGGKTATPGDTTFDHERGSRLGVKPYMGQSIQ